MTSAFGFKRVAPVVLALTAITLSSCLSEMPRFPTMPAARGTLFVPSFIPVVASVQAEAKQEAKPNRIKYSDTGIRGTIGSAGGIAFEPRALLGSDGITLVEVTSGTFDSPSEAQIDRISVKLRNTDLPPVNARPDASTWAGEMSGLVPGDVLQLQANLKALEGRRTVVADAVAPVARRPDIATMALDGATHSYPDAPVVFFATLRELNGDLGARVNCTFSVDGVAVDQATGIWIDRNSVVGCQFAYVFKATGTFTVTVSALDVSPGDWDSANNSVSQTVTVLDPGTPIANGQLDASDEAHTYAHTATRDGAYPIVQVSGGSQMVSLITINANSVEIVPGPFQGLTAKVSADGSSIFENALNTTSVWSSTSGGVTYDCAQYSLNGQMAQSCSPRNPAATGARQPWFFYQHSSGVVTQYYGFTLYCHTIGCNMWTGTTGSGQRYGVSLNSILRVQLNFVDAAGQPHVIDRSVSFQDYSADVNKDVTVCRPWYDGNGDVCTHSVKSGTLWRGKTVWGATP